MMSLVSYLRAGLLLHIITLLEIALLGAMGSKMLTTNAGFHTETGVSAALSFFLTILPIMSQLDARSRFQEYKRIKDRWRVFGFDDRLLKPLANSRCQRDAARAAADELGYGRHCREVFHLLGYRWYHLMPAFIFSNPGILFRRQFWKSTFFLSTYPNTKI